ncbi:aminotransferase class III-fold pyridoxal phosphate-dependent enzyme [Nocardia abscessus]|uniref:aminotransferase class III-fold pyridoxal phosphate-dependent enzyme n=1 Tax=Nocardia abscessus TaxID=120957 RepID=UPI002456AE10|nr:aminotransferase class III-fold pyridoxal phosphate-dependent enzyme [Nocardia abscessus]
MKVDHDHQHNTQQQSRFEPTARWVRDLIIERNTYARPNMLFAGQSVSEEGAHLAYTLSLVHTPGTEAGDCVSFLANSTEEGISAAVKLARHTAARNNRSGQVLFIDPQQSLVQYFDPVGDGLIDALVPGVRSVDSVKEAIEALPTESWGAILIVLSAELDGQSEEVADLLRTAAAEGAMRIVCDRRPIPFATGERRLPAATLDADVWVYGENLTDNQVPFGCSVMTRQAYTVWNNPVDCLAHSSTFGGNGVAATAALHVLRERGYLDDRAERALADIITSRRARNEAFARYVSPPAADLLEAFELDFDIKQARGSLLTMRDGQTLLDCAGGAGASLRGHNPPEVRATVAAHDPAHDYFAELEQYLSGLTGFDHAFPAVSGATCVETALTLARLASPERKTIVTFRGNYSGKTLASLSMSKHGPQRSATIPEAFRPYYSNLVYIDPMSPNAKRDFERALDNDDVGLVWFELIQGFSCREISPDLVEMVDERKRTGGYLIGVDEVLTGGWRTGESFLAHPAAIASADFTTLAKPLSDMTIPMAVVLCRVDAVDRATRYDSTLVERLRYGYRNGLGAHLALDALRAVNTDEQHALRRRELQALRSGLERLAESSPLFEGVVGRGSHLRLAMNRRWFPQRSNSMLTLAVEGSLMDIMANRCRVLIADQRFFPPLFGRPGTMQEAVDRLTVGLADVTPAHVYANLVSRISAHALRQTWRTTLRFRTGGRSRGRLQSPPEVSSRQRYDDSHRRTPLTSAPTT